ncbi:MAG: polysaccharide biosynthesis tyrosine autokinase [Lysobacterales bacterium]|nr:MAG: polysaccharide biosynthesis tyrosine autokinase [Xanthomonadales bacterium]
MRADEEKSKIQGRDPATGSGSDGKESRRQQGNVPRVGPGVDAPRGYPAYHVPGYPSYATMNDSRFAELDLFDFRDLFRSLWIKKRLIMIVLAFALTSWMFYLSIATRVYRGESILELSLRRPRISGQQEAVIDDARYLSSSADQLNTQIMKLQGAGLRNLVLNKAKGTLALHGVTGDDAKQFLKGGVDINLVRRTSMVKITVDFPDPDVAAFLANTYASVALQDMLDVNKSNSKSAVEWLESQMEVQRGALNEMEQRILGFKRTHPLETLEARRDAIRQSLAAHSKDLTESNAERDRLLSLYTDQHPEVITQDQLILAARRQYEEAIENAESLEKSIAEARTELTGLDREREALEVAYKGMLKRIEEARLAADENTATIKIVEPAVAPSVPVKPNKPLSFLLFMLLGGAASVGLALLMCRMDDRVWYIDDVETSLGTRVIGTVPHVEGNHPRGKLEVMSSEDLFGEVAEAFGVIRGLVDTFSEGKTFIVSSTEPEEGKTVCSCNLAIASARSGKRTLLVDFDMRRPKMAGVWNVADPDHSLLSAMTDKADVDFASLPKQSSVNGLDVVVTRAVRNINPAEIFGSRRLRKFLEWASSNYDRVIIDTPPLCVSSDSMVLGGLVDGVILVMRFNKTRKTMVLNAVRRLADTGANLIGAVVTDVDAKRLGFTYGRYGNMRYASYTHPIAESS